MPILKRNGKTFSGTPTKVDTAKSYTTFDSADDKNPTTWSDVELLTSKEEQQSLFSKISTMFKNIRYLYKMLGTTDISHYSDGTVTGAIKASYDKADANEVAIADVNSKLGNTDISAVGDGTLTGGLSVLSNNAYDLKMLGWTVPKECPVQNYVDEDGVFHQIVGRVDLSKLMWEWVDTLNEFRTDLYIMGMNPYSTNIYCSKYKFGSEMYLSGMGIYIKDPNYDSSTISQFKADNKGVYFYYELATEITKPVDGNEAIKLLNDKLGNTDISAIGDGTVTGGLDALNSNLVFNNIYKHRDIGTITSSNIDEWISKHINSNGTFNDIYVGDTITIQDGVYNAVWVVAGFDTEYNKGNTPLQNHHISLIPQTYLFTAPMNDTGTTEGGYYGSKMHTSTLVNVANNLKKALGSHLLERRVLLSKSINSSVASGAGAGYTGASNSWNWYSAYCTLLTEVQVYGSTVFSSSCYDIGEGCSQLPLFKFVNHVYYGRFNFWLRAVASSTSFAFATYDGIANSENATSALSVRPLITIG